ncbi:MAG: hypothetical protein HQL36_03565 [Alphaproteobacteria bacterium]|nr:hypothetical protein [Alphaproteobacteria bacterium]
MGVQPVPTKEEWRQKIIDFYGADADEELFCIPSEGSGTYLSSALIEARMDASSPVVRWERPTSFAELPDHIREAECRDFCERELGPLLRALDPKLRHFLGEDFGRSGDLTVMMPFAIEQNLTRRAPFTVELRNIPFQQQEQILYFICDRLPRFGAGAFDARGNGHYLAERAMQRYGSERIFQVMLTAEWYRENMPPYKAAFEDGGILLSKDADTQAVGVTVTAPLATVTADKVVIDSADINLGGEGGAQVARIGDMVAVSGGSSAGNWPIISGSDKVRAS